MKKFAKQLYVRIEVEDQNHWFVAEKTAGDSLVDGDSAIVGIYKLDRVVQLNRKVEIIEKEPPRPKPRGRAKRG